MGLMDKLQGALQDAIADASKLNEQLEQLLKDDEVAAKTAWEPIKSGGSHRWTHNLQQPSPDRAELKGRKEALLLPGTFALIGISIIIYTAMTGFSQETNSDPIFLYILLAFAASFIGMSAYQIIQWKILVVFDRASNRFLKKSTSCPLNDIHAIQILKYTQGRGSSNSVSRAYYELNLVLKDSSRLNALTQGRSSRMRPDVEKLAEFLGVPIWDFSNRELMTAK